MYLSNVWNVVKCAAINIKVRVPIDGTSREGRVLGWHCI